ncbi:MAG: hypothetical protein NVSMB1_20010 [Polyangiales bacterium]
MTSATPSLFLVWSLAIAPLSRADTSATTAAAPRVVALTGVDHLETLHRESIDTRRTLANAVLIGGLASIVAGAAMLTQNGDDQAFRFAGFNTAAFGAVNSVVGLVARYGIASEEDAWESAEARASRRTTDGLFRARIHAAVDERRESVSHAVNLGLGVAYLAVAGTAIAASQLGVDHPKRWLGSGLAIAAQSAFLIGVDLIGLARSGHYHRAFIDTVTPSIALINVASGAEMRVGICATF